MPLVTIINPSPRKAKMATRKKPRTAAQRRATAKLVAANRARARASRAPAKRASPARRKARRRSTPAAAPVSRAPARRARRKYTRSSVAAASTAGRVLRYRRPNPTVGDFVSQTLMPSAVGGAGALALDVALGALPLPPQLKTGPLAPVVKVVGAVGIGMLAGRFLGRRTGEQVAAGALTVTMYNVARRALQKIGGGKIPGLGAYMDEDFLDAYVSGTEVPALAYTDSGMQVGEYVGDVADSGDGSMEGYETGVYR